MLDPVEISQALTAVERVEFWITELRAHAFDLARRGVKIPGWKLVDKRARRVWADPKKAATAIKRKFGKKGFNANPLSPAQLEKIAPTGWVDKYVASVSSGTTLVPETDPRNRVEQAKKDFSPVPEEYVRVPVEHVRMTRSKKKPKARKGGKKRSKRK